MVEGEPGVEAVLSCERLLGALRCRRLETKKRILHELRALRGVGHLTWARLVRTIGNRNRRLLSEHLCFSTRPKSNEEEGVLQSLRDQL